MTYSVDVFPRRLRVLRHKLGLTQHQLSHVADVQVTAISQYECGRRDPTVAVLCKLANALRVEPSVFLASDPELVIGAERSAQGGTER